VRATDEGGKGHGRGRQERLYRPSCPASRPSDEARAAQLKLGVDLTAVNADGTVSLPMPTVVIADADHVVRWIHVHPDYSSRTEPAQILGALGRLGI
jgi:hypothetical protein